MLQLPPRCAPPFALDKQKRKTENQSPNRNPYPPPRFLHFWLHPIGLHPVSTSHPSRAICRTGSFRVLDAGVTQICDTPTPTPTDVMRHSILVSQVGVNICQARASSLWGLSASGKRAFVLLFARVSICIWVYFLFLLQHF